MRLCNIYPSSRNKAYNPIMAIDITRTSEKGFQVCYKLFVSLQTLLQITDNKKNLKINKTFH